MADFSKYRNSKNLLERASYYAVQASWADSADFEQAQWDAETLQRLTQGELKNADEECPCVRCSMIRSIVASDDQDGYAPDPAKGLI